jgi:hypothetical protein
MLYRADVNMTQGEAVYKAAARIQKYGVNAFINMLGEKAIKARGGRARLLKYYTEKYPEAPLTLEPKAPSISEHMKSYWEDVKLVAEGHGITDKEARDILKREKRGMRNARVKVMITKSGKSWQLVMEGEYKNHQTGETAIEEGSSFLKPNPTEQYEDAFNECIQSALNKLGGAMFGDGYADIEDSDWFLIKVLKETWIRFYGREPTELEGEHKDV